jgi:hypothetical protein
MKWREAYSKQRTISLQTRGVFLPTFYTAFGDQKLRTENQIVPLPFPVVCCPRKKPLGASGGFWVRFLSRDSWWPHQERVMHNFHSLLLLCSL